MRWKAHGGWLQNSQRSCLLLLSTACFSALVQFRWAGGELVKHIGGSLN